jgi:hypothetical protein
VILLQRGRVTADYDASTTMRYVDVGEDDKRDAIAAVFGAFGQQLRQQSPGNRIDGGVFRREIMVTPLGLEPKFSA